MDPTNPFSQFLLQHRYDYANLTGVGLNLATGRPVSLITDDQAKRYSDMNIPQGRFEFYRAFIKVLADPNTKILETVFGTNNAIRPVIERIKALNEKAANSMRYVLSKAVPGPEPVKPAGPDPTKIATYKNEKEAYEAKKTAFADRINGLLRANPPTRNVSIAFVAKAGGGAKAEGDAEGKAEGEEQAGGVPQAALPTAFYQGLVKKADELGTPEKPDSPEEREKIIFELENDPLYSPENTKVNMTDRVTFIALSYVLRALALFLVEWSIQTQLINTFQTAFAFYFGVYTVLFLLVVALVNSPNQTLFRMTFYYLSTRDAGFLRPILHIGLHLILLPIPFLVKDTSSIGDIDPLDNRPTELTFSQRRSLIRSLNNFSFFVWVFVSFIVLVS